MADSGAHLLRPMSSMEWRPRPAPEQTRFSLNRSTTITTQARAFEHVILCLSLRGNIVSKAERQWSRAVFMPTTFARRSVPISKTSLSAAAP